MGRILRRARRSFRRLRPAEEAVAVVEGWRIRVTADSPEEAAKVRAAMWAKMAEMLSARRPRIVVDPEGVRRLAADLRAASEGRRGPIRVQAEQGAPIRDPQPLAITATPHEEVCDGG